MLRAREHWQWLFPVAVTLHNLEEAIWLPGWVAEHANQLPYVAGPAAFRFAAAVLTVAAYVITYLSVHHGRENLWTYLWFGYVVTMLANVFIPHVPAALIFRSYAPGLVTAVVVNLPVMTFLLVHALRYGYASGRKAVVFAVVMPVGIVAMVPILFVVGKLLPDGV
jgi:hypothetical protein